MKRLGIQAFYLCATAFVALLVPACGGKNNGGGGGSGGSSSATPLFLEDFSKAFPGTDWSVPFMTGSGSSIAVDASTGNPAPSLAMTTTRG